MTDSPSYLNHTEIIYDAGEDELNYSLDVSQKASGVFPSKPQRPIGESEVNSSFKEGSLQYSFNANIQQFDPLRVSEKLEEEKQATIYKKRLARQQMSSSDISIHNSGAGNSESDPSLLSQNDILFSLQQLNKPKEGVAPPAKEDEEENAAQERPFAEINRRLNRSTLRPPLAPQGFGGVHRFRGDSVLERKIWEPDQAHRSLASPFAEPQLKKNKSAQPPRMALIISDKQSRSPGTSRLTTNQKTELRKCLGIHKPSAKNSLQQEETENLDPGTAAELDGLDDFFFQIRKEWTFITFLLDLCKRKKEPEAIPASDQHTERVPLGTSNPFKQKMSIMKSVQEEKKLLLGYLQLLRQNCMILNGALLYLICRKLLSSATYLVLSCIGIVILALCLLVMLVSLIQQMKMIRYCYYVFFVQQALLLVSMFIQWNEGSKENEIRSIVYIGLAFATLMNNHFIWVILFQKTRSQRFLGKLAILSYSIGLLYQAVYLNFYESINDSLSVWEGAEIVLYILAFPVYWHLCTNVYKRSNHNIYQRMRKTLIRQAEFKIIFDNLEESLVILNSQEIVFVNDQFLMHFQKIIKRFKDSVVESAEDVQLEETGTKFQVLKTALSKLIKEAASNLKFKIKHLFSGSASATDQEGCSPQFSSPTHPMMKMKIFREYKRDIAGLGPRYGDEKGHALSPSDLLRQGSPNSPHIFNSNNKVTKRSSMNEEQGPPEMSMLEILRSEKKDIQGKSFILLEDPSSHDLKAKAQYVKIKVTKYQIGEAEKTILQFKDITNDILQDQYKAENQLLELINACVSHELRNPLNSICSENIEKANLYDELSILLTKISGVVEPGILTSFKKIIDSLREGLIVQNSSTEMMTYMVQDLLDYAQIKAGKFRSNITQFNIREAVAKVMTIQKLKAVEHDLNFFATFENIYETAEEADRLMASSSLEQQVSVNDLANNQPCIMLQQRKHSPVICSDEQRIMQVLLGLQSNALKFTEKGQIEIKVKIDEIECERYLQISVIDTGIGISEDDQSKLFQLFGFIKDEKKLNTKGIGLGLVIAYQIVQQFGGIIDFKSELGQGSTFLFSFKLSDPAMVHSNLNYADNMRRKKMSEYQLNSKHLVFKWKPQASRNKPSRPRPRHVSDVLTIDSASGSRRHEDKIFYVKDIDLNPFSVNLVNLPTSERPRESEQATSPQILKSTNPMVSSVQRGLTNLQFGSVKAQNEEAGEETSNFQQHTILVPPFNQEQQPPVQTDSNGRLPLNTSSRHFGTGAHDTSTTALITSSQGIQSLPLQSFGIERILRQKKHLIINPEPESEQIRLEHQTLEKKEEGLLSIIRNNIGATGSRGNEGPSGQRPDLVISGEDDNEAVQTLQVMPSVIQEKERATSEGSILLNEILHPDRRYDSLSDSSHQILNEIRQLREEEAKENRLRPPSEEAIQADSGASAISRSERYRAKGDLKILLVDDQVFNLRALEIILRLKVGINTNKICKQVTSGHAAIKEIEDDIEANKRKYRVCFSSYALILMDCNMPQMDGYETTQAIREKLFSMKIRQPVISAVTGHSELVYVKKALNSGMNQVLSKPVNASLLNDLVNKLGYPATPPPAAVKKLEEAKVVE